MIETNTFVLANGKYQPLATVQGPLRDPDYIDGILELSIDGHAIITRNAWDLVDQLWAYIVDGAVELTQGRSFRTRFPDQPLELLFTLDASADTVTVELRHPNIDRPAKASVGRRELIDAIARGAEPVFARLIELVPDNRRGYEPTLEQIELLKHPERWAE
ncbi:MAG TPA: hypothetical protein VF516_38970 [Kofleriaceae bacterium]